MKLRSTIGGFWIAVLVMICGADSVVRADDTEIYFGAGFGSNTIKPNILMVLDTSDSMEQQVEGTGKSRLRNMQDALNQLIGTLDNVNIGLMRFNGVYRDEKDAAGFEYVATGGPILFPVADLDAPAAEFFGEPDDSNQFITAGIANAADDVEEIRFSGEMDLFSPTLDMLDRPATEAASATVQVKVAAQSDDASKPFDSIVLGAQGYDIAQTPVGLRFASVPVPKDAVITSASLSFVAFANGGKNPRLDISAELDRDPLQFNTSPGNIVDRPRTAAGPVVWAPPSWTNGDAYTPDTTSPDLSELVQELVEQPGWVSGNAMVFIMEHKSGQGLRQASSYDDDTPAIGSQAPVLTISYETDAVTEQNYRVGLRFTDVRIPQGATVTSAKISFTAADPAENSGNDSIGVVVENSDDASPYTNTNGDLFTNGSRSYGESTLWTLPGSVTEDEVVDTPDLTPLVQSIVNRPGWCGSNAMAFLFELDSPAFIRRAMRSYDDDPTVAPTLHVTFDQSNIPDGPNAGCVVKEYIYKPADSKDDAREDEDGAVDRSSPLRVGPTGGVNFQSGIRFPAILLDNSSEVLSASIDFVADQDRSGLASFTVAGYDGVSSQFALQAYNVSDTILRPHTGNNVAWSPPNVLQDGIYSTPDLKAIVDEVFAHPDWITGSAMGFNISGTGSLRTAYSYDQDASKAPTLKIRVKRTKNSTGIQKTVRERLLELVEEHDQTYFFTPSIEVLAEAARYWKGGSVVYGRQRGTQSTFNRFMRVSHPASYQDGTLSQTGNCNAANLNDEDCVTETIQTAPATPTYISPFSALECQANYMIFLSDGLPTKNIVVDEVESLIGDTCEESGAGLPGKCGQDIARHLVEEDQASGIGGNQTVKTYTIGFNLTGDTTGEPDPVATAFMNEIAEAGQGKFYEASTASDLVSVLQDIFTDILTDPTSFAAPSLSVNAFNRLFHRNEVYFSLFEPSDRTRWNGNIKKYEICDGSPPENEGDPTCELGEVIDASDPQKPAIGSDGLIADNARSFWSTIDDGPFVQEGGAGANTPDYALRNLYTYAGAGTPAMIDLSAPENAIDQANVATLAPLLGVDASDAPDLIDWIRGKDVDDEDGVGGTVNRWGITDPLHGSPVAVDFGCVGNTPGTPCAADDDPITKIFIGLNDGSIRMYNGGTGEEEWTFYPQEMLTLQDDLRQNVTGPHLYGIDTTPTTWVQDNNSDGIIDSDDGDFVRVFYAMRRGGKNIYALDVTPSGPLSANDGSSSSPSIDPVLMWRIEGGIGDFANLSQTWSRPLPVDMRLVVSGNTVEEKKVVAFAGGYDDAQDATFGPSTEGNSIFLVDAVTGERLWWASNDTSVDGSNKKANLQLAEMDFAMPSDIAMIDTNGDGNADRGYIGDLGGQVWRIDFTDELDITSGAGAGGASGGRLAGLSDDSVAQDRRKFFYRPDVIQVRDAVFSNEPEYDLVTIVSGDRANPLSTNVLDRAYALRDYAVSDVFTETGVYPLEHGKVVDDSDVLYDATDNFLQTGTSEQQDAAKEGLKNSAGWFIDLTEPDGNDIGMDRDLIGEKGLSSPIVLAGKLFFTTFVPSESDDPCQALEGSGRLYGVNAISGVAEFEDWGGDDDGTFETEDRVYELGAGIPSSAVPIFQQEGVTLLIGTGGGAESVDPNIQLPRVRTYWYQE